MSYQNVYIYVLCNYLPSLHTCTKYSCTVKTGNLLYKYVGFVNTMVEPINPHIAYFAEIIQLYIIVVVAMIHVQYMNQERAYKKVIKSIKTSVYPGPASIWRV